MKKNITALLTAVLLMSLTAGCGASGNKETEDAGTASTPYIAYDSTAQAASEEETGEEQEERVFHIYSSGEDFKNRVQDSCHYAADRIISAGRSAGSKGQIISCHNTAGKSGMN